MASVLTAPEVTMADLAALSESSFSGAATDASSNVASFSSTPPTTVSPDSMSLASDPDLPKQDATAQPPLLDMALALLDSTCDEREQHGQEGEGECRQQTPVGHAIVVADSPPPSEEAEEGSPRRARRARASLPVYNLSQLSGTRARRGRRGQSENAAGNADNGLAGLGDALSRPCRAAKEGIDASPTDLHPSSPGTPRSTRNSTNQRLSPASSRITRRATRLSGAPTETLAIKLASLSKRGKKKSLSRMSRELLRLQDTDEFAHIDKRPVKYTVWSNGKYIDVDAAEAQPPPKNKKADESAPEKDARDDDDATPIEEPVKKLRPKKWLEKGLYAGQEAPLDITKGMSTQEKKKLVSLPELIPSGKVNKTLPMPMFNGMRLLINGRDFKLPFDVCNPLPPGQPKPAAYRTMTKSKSCLLFSSWDPRRMLTRVPPLPLPLRSLHR